MSQVNEPSNRYKHMEIKLGEMIQLNWTTAQGEHSLVSDKGIKMTAETADENFASRLVYQPQESTLFNFTTLDNQHVIKNREWAEVTVIRPYCEGVDENGKTYSVYMDLQTPNENRFPEQPYPALLFIHGGGWNSGSYAELYRFIDVAKAHGYVAISIDYRLNQPNSAGSWPAQIQDAKCAVRWLRENADTYQIDSDRIGVVGHSAGAHLALLLGLTHAATNPQIAEEIDTFKDAGSFSGVDDGVQAVVSIGGVTNLAKAYAYLGSDIMQTAAKSGIKTLAGNRAPTTIDDPDYEILNPRHFINRENSQLPFLFIAGSKDSVAKTSQSCETKNALEHYRSADDKVDVLEYPDATHFDFIAVRKTSDSVNPLDDFAASITSAISGAYVDQTIYDVFQFLDFHLKGNQQAINYSVAPLEHCMED